MFFQGQTVRSEYHGLGEVIKSGDRPLVRFLAGWEGWATADTLKTVPADRYDTELLNRTIIERFLTLWIYGRLPSESPALPRPRFELIDVGGCEVYSPTASLASPTAVESEFVYFDWLDAGTCP